MSAIRHLPLLSVVLVLLMSVQLSVVAADVVVSDPTKACYTPIGDSGTGVWLGDRGYYDFVELQSYSSTNYYILCAWRALYLHGPNGATNVWGPWHGNSTQDTTNCDNSFTSRFTNVPDWAQAGAGAVGTRANSATGNQVIVDFKLGGVCSSNYICAGLCPGSANYASAMTVLASDPTYKVTPFTTVAGFTMAAAPNTSQVISTLNGTASTNTTVAPMSPGLPNKVLSVVTSIQYCYGYVNVTC